MMMMTDREKLVELISDARINGHRVDDLFYRDFAEGIADHLIANGVTVQNLRREDDMKGRTEWDTTLK